MLRTIGNSLLFGAVYFLLSYLVSNVILHTTNPLFSTPRLLSESGVMSIGYFVGFRQGSRDRDCNVWLAAGLWAAIYSAILIGLHGTVGLTEREDVHSVLLNTTISASAFFMACHLGKRSEPAGA